MRTTATGTCYLCDRDLYVRGSKRPMIDGVRRTVCFNCGIVVLHFKNKGTEAELREAVAEFHAELAAKEQARQDAAAAWLAAEGISTEKRKQREWGTGRTVVEYRAPESASPYWRPTLYAVAINLGYVEA